MKTELIGYTKCWCCGEKLYEGENVFIIDGQVYCSDRCLETEYGCSLSDDYVDLEWEECEPEDLYHEGRYQEKYYEEKERRKQNEQ